MPGKMRQDLVQVHEPAWLVAKLEQWMRAYPLEIFPEPDFKRAAKALKAQGMTIDAISAANFRFVLRRVLEMISQGDDDAEQESSAKEADASSRAQP